MSSRSALIIDDEPDTRTYLATLLSDNGWTARTANSVDDGLALAREQVPDVVLLDLMMPERGGLSALVELRKTPELSSVPIVIVSGIQETLTSDFRAFLKWCPTSCFRNWISSRWRSRQLTSGSGQPVGLLDRVRVY
jgi:CheY-like chemotaxis protein